MATGIVLRHIWALKWCSSTYGNRIGAGAQMGTRMLPNYIWAPKGCLGLHWH